MEGRGPGVEFLCFLQRFNDVQLNSQSAVSHLLFHKGFFLTFSGKEHDFDPISKLGGGFRQFFIFTPNFRGK